MPRLVIIGHCPAAHRLVERLTAQDYPGSITVLDAAEQGPHNPALLPTVLAHGLAPELAALPEHPSPARVHRNTRVTSIDRTRRRVRTEAGEMYDYDVLVLATGTRAVVPDLPGVSDQGLPAGRTWPLRKPDEGIRMRGQLAADASVTVLGGGLDGVETAHALATAGYEVSLLHREQHPLPRRLDRAAGRIVADTLRDNGVNVLPGETASEFLPGKLVLASGEAVSTEALVLRTGTRPDTAPAGESGLEVSRGIVVDSELRTGDPRVHALGGCAEPPPGVAGSLLEWWEQAEALAAILLGSGNDIPPQPHGAGRVLRARGAGLELASIGSPELLTGKDHEVEHVTFNDPKRRRYARLALREDRLVAATLLGLPEAIATLSQLHDTGMPVPSDRLATLLDLPTGFGTAGSVPADPVLCHCNNVSRSTLTAAYRDGARDVAALAAVTRATTGCGSCTGAVRELCGSLAVSTTERVPSGTDSPEQEGAE
ncbi:assimilatory nitrate reductase electron transfer subunit [Actinopolyspora mzabensis]|uniref:Assimilatory nitrate reductase electron transfer subunit n=1 Tax=Actinopolyspora mzabensis TaxID=995066 RepID=A0A1G9EWV8_ACTMZ|nr:FAD-dependent oxidoreductase [Actinopolyspora mzabensis]SDK80636.1 assimilatory nitrate reductase electron transfer subunit [Actinopolyspora mzabensis]